MDDVCFNIKNYLEKKKSKSKMIVEHKKIQFSFRESQNILRIFLHLNYNFISDMKLEMIDKYKSYIKEKVGFVNTRNAA